VRKEIADTQVLRCSGSCRGKRRGIPETMNESGDIPSEIRLFVTEKIDSVPHLEALLLLWNDPSKVWTEDSLALALYIAPLAARKIVHGLERRGWVKSSEAPPGFVFDGAWDADGAFMPRLAETYRRQLVRVATLIHSNASAAVREFADAFNLKKD
jgi:hypothetical protein